LFETCLIHFFCVASVVLVVILRVMIIRVVVFKHFPDRSYNEFLTVILHLQEVVITQGNTGNKYTRSQQVGATAVLYLGHHTAYVKGLTINLTD